MLDIHDNEITKYDVDLINQKITMHTLVRDTSTQILIIFEEVIAHKFENHLRGSILFEIEKKHIESFVTDNYEELKTNKNYGWPICYETFEELNDILINESYSYYVIASSYGLNGWILSKSLTIKLANDNRGNT